MVIDSPLQIFSVICDFLHHFCVSSCLSDPWKTLVYFNNVLLFAYTQRELHISIIITTKQMEYCFLVLEYMYLATGLLTSPVLLDAFYIILLSVLVFLL